MTVSKTLASYLPRMVVDHVARRVASSAPAKETEQLFPAAVMLADVSGFTKLAERLQQQGPVGAESLTRILNAYFGPLIDRIHASGGDVVKFAGDAMMVLWQAPSEAELGPPILASARCGLDLQAWSTGGQTAPEDERLALKVSIAAGTMRLCHVGGVAGRWELLVTGEPLSALNKITHGAKSGRVLLTPEVAATLPGARLEKHDEPGETGVFLAALDGAHAPAAAPSAAPDGEGGLADALRGYIPRTVLDRLDQASWLSELRTATVMFVNFPNATYQTPLARAHLIAQLLQSTLDRHEGTLNKLSVDEKGVSMVAAFGLPPRVHEDDPARAVATALSLHQGLEKLSVLHAIGLTTGRVFCGVVGSAGRREYTVMGDSVNLSARLMQAAKNSILADQATMEGARARASFEAVPPLTVKGKSEPIPAFHPTGLIERQVVAASTSSSSASGPAMVGREKERARAAALLSGLKDSGRSGLLLVEGEAGIGKSVMVADVRAQAEGLGLKVLVGWGDAVEAASPYYAFRAAVGQLAGSGPAEERRARLLSLLENDPAALALAPLLNAILPLGLPDTRATAEMSGQLRADNTRDLLLRLFAAAAARDRLVLVLEDHHWLDSASHALALALLRRVRPLLVVASTRPPADPPPAEYRALVEAAGPERIVLEALSAEETLRLVCRRLKVDALPQEVTRLINERAAGHPFFSEELAYALRDSGALRIHDGRCELSGPAGSLDATALPKTVQGIITTRVDRLPPAEQLTLKAASVVGRVFSLDALAAVHPQKPDRQALLDQLGRLEKLDLTPLDTPGATPTYLFKHAVTHQVVYELMLFAQRSQLHAEAARFIEEHRAAGAAPDWALLAHHWGRAGDKPRTLDCLEKAGEQALQSGAYAEARRFLCDAEALDAAEPGLVPPGRAARIRRGRRQRLLGNAEMSLGNLPASMDRLRESVRLLGAPLPSSRPRWALSLAGHVLRQLGQRLTSRGAVADPFERERADEAAQAYERLGPACIFFNLPMDALFCSLAGTNLAGRVGPSPVLATAFANFAIGLSVAPMPRLAERYLKLAFSLVGPDTPIGAEAWVREMAGLFCNGAGRWDEAVEAFSRSGALHQQLGDRRRQEECELILSLIRHLRGDLAGARATAQEVVETCGKREDRHMLGGSGAMLGLSLHRLGRFDEAAATAERAAGNAREVRALPELVWALGVQSAAELARGEKERAREAAEEAVRTMADLMPTASWVIEGYACTAETLVRLSSGRPELEGAAKKALAGVDRCAKTFPWLRPRRLYLRGLWTDRTGDWDKGNALYRRAIAGARELGSVVDEALALAPMADPLVGAEHAARLKEIQSTTGLVLPQGPARAKASS